MKRPNFRPAASHPRHFEGAWYGDICVAGSADYLALGERSLARLTTLTGDTAMATRRQQRIESQRTGIVDHDQDARAGFFLGLNHLGQVGFYALVDGQWLGYCPGAWNAPSRSRLGFECAAQQSRDREGAFHRMT